MKMKMTLMLMVIVIVAVLFAGTTVAQVSQEVLDSISTPNKVETSIGTLEFLDGAPYPETAEKVYDFIDTMRGADSFLKREDPLCNSAKDSAFIR